MNSNVENLPPHVLLFPFPAHSHVHSLLKLAELLCHGGLRVTFLVADQTHSRLVNDTAVRSHFDRYSGRFRFQNLHDGLLPKDRIVPEFPVSFLEAAKPRFEDVLVAGKSSITCIIVDVMMLSFAVDVAGQVGVPIMCHPNSCPSDLWAVRCVPKLIEAGEIPFQENLPPHVLLFPFPAHSHVHSLLKLAELLCHGGLCVTFLVTDQTHSLLVNDTAVRSHFDRYSGRFRFQNLHDGLLPKDRTVPEFPSSFLEAAMPRFKDLLVAGKSSITCIIVDIMVVSFAVDVAEQIGVPIMCHPSSCPSDLWAVRCVPKLIEAGEIPFQGMVLCFVFWPQDSNNIGMETTLVN
ncbi:hypothetical protein Vadar_027386 [Vaccinium darrowii]|uniref:Uncharacterized protein n=1 Tax=Vaccinium darrowii TaxID=229202 RepID=A0ACB7Y3E6_9ERIC|nr:hypothetical protein Vadar_027386 [Vaccinium darrowii]